MFLQFLYLLLGWANLEIAAKTLYNYDSVIKVNNVYKLQKDRTDSNLIELLADKVENLIQQTEKHTTNNNNDNNNQQQQQQTELLLTTPEHYGTISKGYSYHLPIQQNTHYYNSEQLEQEEQQQHHQPQWHDLWQYPESLHYEGNDYASISKDVYTYAAPDEVHEISLKPTADNYKQRNYKLLFIKAPSHDIKLSAESLHNIQNLNEQKTIVYLLSKQPNLHTIEEQLQHIQQNNHNSQKPEVYFVKYRTPEEAEYTKRFLEQHHYSIGHNHHESVAAINGGNEFSSHLTTFNSNFDKHFPTTHSTHFHQPNHHILPVTHHSTHDSQILTSVHPTHLVHK